MNASIQRITIGSTGRWRSWAKALVASRPRRRLGVIRRRGPLEMALLRRTRLASWIAPRNILSVNLEEKFPVFNAVRLRLAFYWSSPLASIPGKLSGPSLAQDRSPMLLELKTTTEANFAAHQTLHTEQRHSRSLLRELTERTRRLEQRVRIAKRLVIREHGSTSVSAEAQELRRRMGPDWWRADTTAQRQRATPAAAVNVDQIAETVMRQIDHRVSAWRERTGRI
ncbi:MAG: hypothetical protein WA815_04150 [Terracidiphilus sp.]